jgi:hypothetical protein
MVDGSYVYLNHFTGEANGYQVHKQFRSASPVKLFIAIDYLDSLHASGKSVADICDDDLALLQPMPRTRYPDFQDTEYGHDLTNRAAELLEATTACARMDWLLQLGTHLHATAHDHNTILCLAEDVRCIRGWSQGIAIDHLQVAHDIHERFPTTRARLEAGDLSYEHVRVLSQECFTLTDDEKARWVEQQALPLACRRTPNIARMTPQRFRLKVRALIAMIDDDAKKEREKQAFENRDFWTSDPLDGMCTIVTCVAPGCTRKALRCEIDHNYAFDFDNPIYPDQTVVENLACLCKRHHDMKTNGDYDLDQTEDADFIWTTPTGRQWQRHGDSIFPLFNEVEPVKPAYVVDYEEVAPF